MERVRARCGAGLRAGAIAMLVVACATVPARAGEATAGWKTYRSTAFGYELSYPPEMEFRAFFGGSSGELQDASTGRRLIDLEVWPPGTCPRQPPGTAPKAVGTERAATVTQTDGPTGSSWCGEPVTVKASLSRRGVRLFELELTCVEERGDDEEGGEPATPVRRTVGRKGPTFFADVSQSWRTRVLMVDPAGADPRQGVGGHAVEAKTVRSMLDTIVAFPVPEPEGVCVEDLR